MHPKTNPFLVLLITISTTSILTGGSLHPQHRHGGGCIPAERPALLSFKKGITSDPTNRLASWHGRDCCRWTGVKCSNRTGHVLKLHLRNPIPHMDAEPAMSSSFTFCEISSSLLSLEHLEHLDLSMNYLQGPQIRIPEFLGSMMNLKYLNLSGIPFSGRVPQFGNLSKLQYLDLGQQDFSGMYSTDITWLTNLPLLQYLGMSGIILKGIADWPHTLNTIPSLRVIHLSSCSLDTANQSLPYFNLSKLEKLDLSRNNFDHSIASSWFWKATSLKYLNIGDNNLFGQLPDAIGNMSSLQVLDLSYNWLMTTGNLKNLCSLKTLDLSGNWINEYITVFIEGFLKCAWKILQELHLRYNNFTGSLPNLIGKFTTLSILDLSSNNLIGSIPPGIGYLTSLTALDLSSNLLSGSVPSEIGTLSNLTSLQLRSNDLSGVIIKEHFAGLVSLKNIDFSSNNLKVVVDSDWLPPFRLESAVFKSCQMGPLFPAWLQWQTEITNLDISSTALRDKIPNWFWSTFSHATYLDISHNQISGSLLAHMDDMAFVQLDVSSNRLTGPIPSLPRNITFLDISNNAFSGTIPSNLEAPGLETLLMYSNKICGSIPESMCKLQSLDDLDLSSNLLDGEFPQCFKGEIISNLLVSSNNLSGKFPEFLLNCTSLEFLDLAWNKFSGRLPEWIGQLGTLRFLRLSHNAFYGNVPVEVTNLSYLQYLDISGNNLSGVIPWHLSNLTCMTMKGLAIHGYTISWMATTYGQISSIFTKGQKLSYGDEIDYFVSIDLSSNSLTGEIPIDIISLDALINLNLSSNHLSGNIPNKIGALQSLESLDLSKNKLSGEIPSSLSSLTSLSYLNLSYNNLSGRIPSGRQLGTLNVGNPSIMYIGNSGLCGPPLQKNCSGNDTFNHDYLGSNKQEFEPMTFYFGVGVGLVVGLWMVFCALLFKKTWRIAYFRLFDKLYDKIYVFVVVNWASLARKAAIE